MAARRARKPARTAPDAPPTAPPGPYAAARARDEALRAQLVPLAPGERPGAVLAAVAVAAVLGLVNISAFLAGATIEGHRPGLAGVLGFSALMLIAAVGLWQLRYWAVLGFEALLAVVLLVFTLFLLRASNALAVVLCVAIIGGGGLLFWKLIRAMARMQAPQRLP